MYLKCFIWFLLFILEALSVSNSPNFIFVLTDDQDVLLNSMKSLKNVQELIGRNGITFENMYVNSPICCPSRSSILTGKHAHNIKVFNNSLSGNCSSLDWQRDSEPHSISSKLKTLKNYSTFYAGKYLNQYGYQDRGLKHVPAGYDWWLGLKGNSVYYNYSLSINGTEKFFAEDYLTDTLKTFAIDFLRTNHDKQFFMTLAPPACHAPFMPAARHQKMFPNEEVVKNNAFNYTSDGKHWLVTMPPKYLPSNVSILSSIQRKRLQTLLSVDEVVKDLVVELKTLNIYSNTYFIFTSDNGYHIGQFGQPWDKRQPYESDIKVPFLISGPGIPKNKIYSHAIAAIDIAPTILDLANIAVPNDMDGVSFKEILKQDDSSQRYILVEYWGEADSKRIDTGCPWKDEDLTECRVGSWCKCQDSRNNTYSCVLHLSKTTHFKMCSFSDELDFIEAYDLKSDPYELVNVVVDLKYEEFVFYRNMLHKLERCVGEECRFK